MKHTLLKMNSNILNRFIQIQHSEWMRPALMTLALAFAVLGVDACKPHH